MARKVDSTGGLLPQYTVTLRPARETQIIIYYQHHSQYLLPTECRQRIIMLENVREKCLGYSTNYHGKVLKDPRSSKNNCI